MTLTERVRLMLLSYWRGPLYTHTRLTIGGLAGKVLYQEIRVVPCVQVIRVAPLHDWAWCGALGGAAWGGGALEGRVHPLVSQTLQGGGNGHVLAEVVDEFLREAAGGRGLGCTALVANVSGLGRERKEDIIKLLTPLLTMYLVLGERARGGYHYLISDSELLLWTPE